MKKTAAYKPTPKDLAVDPQDVNVGYMIEGMYQWNEFCTYHGEQYLRCYPERHHRTISIWEHKHARREYKCYQCRITLVGAPS